MFTLIKRLQSGKGDVAAISTVSGQTVVTWDEETDTKTVVLEVALELLPETMPAWQRFAAIRETAKSFVRQYAREN